MIKSFIYRDYVGRVDYPPDDFNDVTAMKPVKLVIDEIFKNFNENGVNVPEKLSGSSGQIIWEAEYIQLNYA